VPTTDQGFVGCPPKGSTTALENAERGMTLGTSDTWPRFGLCSRGTLGHFRDQQERFCNGIPSEGGIEPSDPIKRVAPEILFWGFVEKMSLMDNYTLELTFSKINSKI
jgi:hypothetical protein